MSLSDNFSNLLSSEVTELNQNLQGVTLNPENQSDSSSQQEMVDTNTVDKLVLDPVLQEVMSSISQKTSWLNQDRVSSAAVVQERISGLFLDFRRLMQAPTLLLCKALVFLACMLALD